MWIAEVGEDTVGVEMHHVRISLDRGPNLGAQAAGRNSRDTEGNITPEGYYAAALAGD